MVNLADIAREIKDCQKCSLSQKRHQAVPGEGNPRGKIVFIGEAPGATEDKLGRPFVGSAGKFLDELLVSVGLKRDQVFITNIVKCRPPGNRDPQPLEISTCLPYLARQLKIIKPKVIVTLGRHSLKQFFPQRNISADHGKAFKKNHQVYFFAYHPAAALYDSSMKQVMLSDFQKLRELLNKINS
jgi:DNA polymerase